MSVRMSVAAAPTVVSPTALAERLGRYALGASRDLRAVADLAAGEELGAVVVALWQHRGWLVVATDVGLRLARRPRLLGRERERTFDWRLLRAVSSGQQRVVLGFEGEDVSLAAAGPHREFVRLLDIARGHLEGDEKPSVDHVRDIANAKLGRLLARGFEASIDGLPDRLEPGERVERLAGARHGFYGLLVLTDRRLLLLDVALRQANERIWDVRRSGIRTAEPVKDGLRLLLTTGEATLTDFVPPDRRDEFATVLGADR